MINRKDSLSNSRPKSASTPSVDDLSISRTAVNLSADLGCPYNARADSILDSLLLNRSVVAQSTSRKPVHCRIMKSETLDVNDLCRLIKIDDDLWLNLMLKIVPAEGITTLVHHSSPRSTNTRYLHYYYFRLRKWLPDHRNKVMSCMSQTKHNITATHLISEIKYGIHALVVLQLPPDDPTTLDYLLETLEQQLTANKLDLTKDETLLLNTITVSSVFSNMNDLTTSTKLYDVCRKITEMRPHTCNHRPLEYTLRPIRWFYPSYSREKAKHTPLEPDTIQAVKQYITSLPSKISELNSLLDSELRSTLQKYLERQYDLIREQIISVENIHSDARKQICRLVRQVRTGKEEQEVIIEFLKDIHGSQENILDCTTNKIHLLIEKIQLINQLKREGVKYLDLDQCNIQEHENLNAVLSKVLKIDKRYLVFCSTDEFRCHEPESWNGFYNKWLKEREANNSITLVYADFSYTSLPLSKTKILSLDLVCKTVPESQASMEPSSTIMEGTQTSRTQDQKNSKSPRPSAAPTRKNTSSTDDHSTPSKKRKSSYESQTSGLRSDTDLPQDEQNRDYETLLANENALSGSEHCGNTVPSTDDLNLTKSSTPKPTPPPRKSKQPVTDSRISSPSECSAELPNAIMPVVGDKNDGVKEHIDISRSPTVTSSLVTSSPGDHLVDTPKPLTPKTSAEPSSGERTPPSEQHPHNTHQRDDWARVAPSSPTETPLGAEEQIQVPKAPTKVELISSPLESSATEGQPTLTPRERRRGKSGRVPAISCTNILLLGESGVGKSTFINALVNYHAFGTLEHARASPPLVVMPVSFIVTMGDQFEERTVRFGEEDRNEDHDHPGQSVTQDCKSYTFSIDSHTKLRIIDTPGMGDTRGLEQDDLNMQHILSFINNLPHLNAICILLKPNESRLNVVLRSYFTRLLSFLGEDARENIVFCFTNTRSTFFAPGNTAPLLREMINKFPIKGIPFRKSNTFCFDSESFRYLIASQDGIEFDAFQNEEYEKSWQKSVTESDRLVRYICDNLRPYAQKEWQSIEHAQFKIKELIRPMLETARNTCRNIILLKEKDSPHLIKLLPSLLRKPAAICYHCKRTPQRLDDFWILPDKLHIFSGTCTDCECPENEHMVVEYKLNYELVEHMGNDILDEMQANVKQLRLALLEFAQFYASTGDGLQKNDPILRTLNRLIDDENQLCSREDSTRLNSKLSNILSDLLDVYKQRRKVCKSAKIPIDLQNVYDHIQRISSIGDINEQLRAVKQTQVEWMKQHEKQVS